MSNIPKAREILLHIADKLDPEFRTAITGVVNAYLYREPKVRRAPTKSAEITHSMKRQIFALAKTDMHLSEIGHRLGINQGRVSEVLNGKR